MSNASNEFINKVKDILLSEPLTQKGRMSMINIGMSMTKNEFFKSVYVEPFSVYKRECETEIINTDEDADVDMSNYKDIVDLNVLSTQKDKFESSVKNLNDCLFIIKGVAGSGKTTYLYELLRNINDKIEPHIYNFEEVRQSNAFMGTSFDLKLLYSNNVYKFLSIILLEISKIIGKGEKTLEEHHEFIKKITEIYKLNFQVTEEELKNSTLLETNVDTEEQQELFGLLQKYAEETIDYNELSKNIKNKFINRFNPKNGILDLSYTVGFAIRLYFCISKIFSKKQLFIVDNIETFLPNDTKHPIQQCELEHIIHGCYDAAIRAREILNPIQKIGDYNTFYGFLIVTRETTASTVLCDFQHYDDFKKENEIDISEWFCTDEIFKNKKDFCKEKGLDFEENCYYEFYQNILCDFSAYRWGLNGIISKMYKHSHRRNVECVPEAICVRPEDEIRYFNKLWKKRTERGLNKGGLKAVCRKYVLRILLDNVQRKQYFDKLMVENLDLDYKSRDLEHKQDILSSKPHRKESNSYARKIATMLHNVSLNKGRDKYVSFPRILLTILMPSYKPDRFTDTKIKNFGKILFLMNETRNEITNWTSLVCIKYDSSQEYNENNLCNILVEQWHEYKEKNIELDDVSKYGVKITEAGEFFAKILADFEYFACRFLAKEPPLFSLENIKLLDKENKNSFRAIEIINIVRTKAFSCIDEIIKRDKETFIESLNRPTSNHRPNYTKMYDSEYSWVYKDSPQAKAFVHPYRILTQHYGYLSCYFDYIEKFVPEEDFEKTEYKDSLLSLLKSQILQYKFKLRELMNSNPEYFRL